MTIDEFRKALSAIPSQPFRVRLADGRPIAVPQSDFGLFTGGGRTAIISHRKMIGSLSNPSR